MTANKRIFLNIVATYGRSLFALVCGLFSARWVLAALGVVDYGLYGVIGGLVIFVTFINNLLQMAVGRFYAVKVGEANVAQAHETGIDECRKWFNTALLLHTVIPLILITIGYPVGDWAVRHFLSIPADRILDCVWVWRFTCISSFVAMVTVPFQAMYTAKQEIAELTIYGFATTTLNTIFFYYMATHTNVWLKGYALWMCLMVVIPNLIISCRAVIKYPECRIQKSYLWSLDRMQKIFEFAGARFITVISGVFFNQGQAILANKYFGPAFNSAMTIGNNVSGQASTLSSSLSQAFWPAIANAAGEGDLHKVHNYTFMTCRFGTLLLLLFVIPLTIEVDEVLLLWLNTPPVFAAELCVAILISFVFERSTDGYWMAIFGLGKHVTSYSLRIGWLGLIGFFSAWIMLILDVGYWSVAITFVLVKALTVIFRLVLGRSLAGLSIRQWVRKVALPLSLLSIVSLLFGALPRMCMSASLLRVISTSVSSILIFLPMTWFFVLSNEERMYILNKVKRKQMR